MVSWLPAANILPQCFPAIASKGPVLITTSNWRCRKLFSQWQGSFQLKAALPLAETLASASRSFENTRSRQSALLLWQYATRWKLMRDALANWPTASTERAVCNRRSRSKPTSPIHHTFNNLIIYNLRYITAIDILTSDTHYPVSYDPATGRQHVWWYSDSFCWSIIVLNTAARQLLSHSRSSGIPRHKNNLLSTT